MRESRIRVIQYGLGPIGIEAAKYALKKSFIEIVGAADVAPGFAGKDLGEVLGVGRTLDIPVSDNPSKLLAHLPADAVIHTAGSRMKTIFPQIMEIVESGKNIVSSAEELLFPSKENRTLADRLHQKAIERGVTVLGTGVNPGFVMDALPLFMTGVCQEVKSIRVVRVVDAATRRYPLQKKIGAGMSPEVFRAKMEEKAMGHVGLSESLSLIASQAGLGLDEITETVEPAVAEKPVKTKYFDLKAGDIAGIKNIAIGYRKGIPVITLDLRMYIGAEDPHDAVSIEGTPPVSLRIEGGVAGDTATAAILINSIPAVVAAPPGLVTVKDLPFPFFRA